MKRFITSLIAIIYLCLTTGADLHLHYCMGEFVNLSFTDTNTGACTKCGMQNHNNDNGCCKDVEISAKISDAHILSSFESLPPQQIVFLPVATFELANDYTISFTPAIKEFYGSGYPPLLHSSIYIEQRNLRI